MSQIAKDLVVAFFIRDMTVKQQWKQSRIIVTVVTTIYYSALQHNDFTNATSVGLKPKIPKEPQLLYFNTEIFEQFRFHSI